MRSFVKGTFSAFSLFLARLTTHIIPGSSSEEEYFYNGEKAAPVIEFIKPDKIESESDNEYKSRIRYPNFLASEGNGPRIVEFYAPWCPHCKKFKHTYVQIAQKVSDVVPNVKFYAISCTTHTEVCKDQHVTGYPTIKYFSAGNSTGVQLTRKELSLEGMKIFFASEFDTDDETVQTYSLTKAQAYNDATVSFNFALRNSVFMTRNALSNSGADAFETWLRLLYDTLPHTMTETKNTIRMLLDDISGVVKSEKTLLDTLANKEIVSQSDGKINKYGGVDPAIISKGWTAACSHGAPALGYTCGLWELFHIMTIGLVEKNHALSKPISTMHAAESLNKYVEHFFACEECRHNFNAVYDSCSFDRCNRLNWNETKSGEIHWKQLPLWLWEVHNDVNTRLMKENNIRLGLPEPTFEDQQIALWPSRNDCQGCWNDDGTWREDEVYLYLYNHYWPSNTRTSQTHALQNDTAQISTSQWFSQYLLAIITMSLLALWLTVRKRKLHRDLSGHHKKADDGIV